MKTSQSEIWNVKRFFWSPKKLILLNSLILYSESKYLSLNYFLKSSSTLTSHTGYPTLLISIASSSIWACKYCFKSPFYTHKSKIMCGTLPKNKSKHHWFQCFFVFFSSNPGSKSCFFAQSNCNSWRNTVGLRAFFPHFMLVYVCM